jgi:chromosome segregation ATPase
MAVALTLAVLRSGVRPAGTERSAFGPMLISEMEAILKSLDRRVENLDQRVGRIEQILPTLATRADLDRYATKDELRAEIRGVKVLIEDVRGDYRLLAEHVSSLMEDSLGAKQQFALLHGRLDQLGNQMADVLRHLNRRRPERE